MEEESSHGCYGAKAWRPAKTWASATVFVLFTVVVVSGVFLSWIDIVSLSSSRASPFDSLQLSFPLLRVSRVLPLPLNEQRMNRSESSNHETKGGER